MGGDDSVRALPVPMSNTEVKPHCADGTAGVTLWESRTSPPTLSVPKGLRRLAPWSYSVGIPPTQLTESQGVIFVLATKTAPKAVFGGFGLWAGKLSQQKIGGSGHAGGGGIRGVPVTQSSV